MSFVMSILNKLPYTRFREKGMSLGDQQMICKGCYNFLFPFFKMAFYNIEQTTNPRGSRLKTIYTAAAIFQFQYKLMKTARWLWSGAAVNIRFPGTEFRRGPPPLQLHSILECRAWSREALSWSQDAHMLLLNIELTLHEKSLSFYT